ncbi:MAG: hypothetical protein COA93_04410 [Alphaproteobacteria bacterium]|nr:MAG: hypothetical protein COA93_04410 [Alphaproteobacteria bacterium]
MTICDLHQKKIISIARSCVGSSFRHQGRDPANGLDCIGLIIYVAKAIGLTGLDHKDYKRIPEKSAISRHAITANFGRCSKNELKPGNVLILKFGKYLEHAAIISDRGIIHACEKYGKVVEHGLDDVWRSRIISVHAFPQTFIP